jgi:hypothetical protein
LQRSHRCAEHNAGRNAHNLENAFAVGRAITPVSAGLGRTHTPVRAMRVAAYM